MKILLTGSDGLIGSAIQKQLAGYDHTLVPYDLKQGKDICDAASLVQAGRGCDAVVHLAALLGNSDTESAEEILRTNLLGTWNVLESARTNGVSKFVFMSSVDVLGIFKGEGAPACFPIDDDHPCNPTTPYGISKKLGEEACRAFSEIHRIPTICFRPPGVWSQQTYFDIVAMRKARPEYEWDPYWEYGAFVDVRDLATLIVKCLETDLTGYGCYLVASDDITTSGGTSLELARRLHPQVEWRAQQEYVSEPYRSLLDCHRARDTFKWSPQYSWKRFIEENRTATCN